MRIRVLRKWFLEMHALNDYGSVPHVLGYFAVFAAIAKYATS